MEQEAKKEHGPGDFNEEGAWVKEDEDIDINSVQVIPPKEYWEPLDCTCDDRDQSDAKLSETTLAQTSGECPDCDCDD